METGRSQKLSELRNHQLKEIAWVQSHVIRSPLANIMALIDLIKGASAADLEKDKLLDYLLSLAYELDKRSLLRRNRILRLAIKA